jgi:prepilin-type N-terminal cleavage/methylation domain-containing protein
MRRRDAGFTLVELLLAVTILGIIAVPLTGAFLLLLKTNGAIGDRVSAAHDELMLAGYWPQDVQSTTSISTTDTTTCAAVAGGATLVARLRWTDLDASNVTVTRAVSYWSVPATASSDAQLVRETCDDGGSPGTMAVRGAVTVTHQLTSASISCFDASGGDTTATGCSPLLTARLTVSSTTASSPSVLTGRRRSA